MSGDIRQSMIKVAKQMVNSLGFESDITLTPLTGDSLQLKGFFAKRNLLQATEEGYTEGVVAHVTVDNKVLADNSYPFRDSDGDISMRLHKVTVADADGVSVEYSVMNTKPSQTFGLTVLVLSDYVE